MNCAMAGAEPAPLVRVGDRLGEGHRALAIGQDRGERRLVRDERPDLLRVRRHEGERVHRATAAGEEVDRARVRAAVTLAMTRCRSSACCSGVDGLAGSAFMLRSTPRGS